MHPNTVKKIIEINREFYQTFAQPFAATRQRLQPGVRQIIKRLDSPLKILDLGCGNGEIARSLFKDGFQGSYVGVDFSRNLLEVACYDHPSCQFLESKHQAEELLANRSAQGIFLEVDLSNPDWDADIPSPPFDMVFTFAVLHHIPGEILRLQTLEKIHKLLKTGGFFWHSEWQFMNSTRLRERIQSWEKVNLNESQVDPGDYLLDWRQGGTGYRYVHLFDGSELDRLAILSGFSVQETFYSDGEGNRLALYQKWQKL
jgi:SAM-dependent methyltransferase